MRISDWSSDVCSSDLVAHGPRTYRAPRSGRLVGDRRYPGSMAAPYDIRLIGDPVLRQRAHEITDVDGKLARLAEDMVTTMYEAPGLGLAGPQVGVQKRIFVRSEEHTSELQSLMRISYA